MTECQHAAQGNAGEIQRVGSYHLSGSNCLGSGQVGELDANLQVTESADEKAARIELILADLIRHLTLFEAQFDHLRVTLAGNVGIGHLFADAVVLTAALGVAGTGFDFGAVDFDDQAHFDYSRSS